MGSTANSNAGVAGNSSPTNGTLDFKLVNGVKSVEFGKQT